MIKPQGYSRSRKISLVGVIDIGSNSIRLVIYESMKRVPVIFFNEKVMCGLGRGIDLYGYMGSQNMERALKALERFRAILVRARVTSVFVLATSAVRDALNGADFIHRSEDILGQRVLVLSGQEEAFYSAMGVVSGYHSPNDGVVGDLGGGSLDLAAIVSNIIGYGLTLPIGSVRLFEHCKGTISEAGFYVRRYLQSVEFLPNNKNKVFYAVGGTWRAIARLHMQIEDYPLQIIQGYEIDTYKASRFLKDLVQGKFTKHPAWKTIPKNRRSLVSFGALRLGEILEIMKPSIISFSAFGMREGYLYSQLTESKRRSDPLLIEATDLSILYTRTPDHSHELAEWTGKVMPFLGMEETDEEARYRKVFCLLSDVQRYFCSGYVPSYKLKVISPVLFMGITHAGCAYIELVNYYQCRGLKEVAL